MTESKNIKELIEVVDFGLDIVQLGIDIGKDKKVDMSDLARVLKKAPTLIGEGVAAVQRFGDIPLELKDLTEEESAEIVAHVMAKLSIESDKAKKIIEKSF